MHLSQSEIKYDFARWLAKGAVRDNSHRREILNVAEHVLPWFIVEKINPDFTTLYAIEDADEVHRLWHKIKTDIELREENSKRTPVNYTDVLHLYESYLHSKGISIGLPTEDTSHSSPEFLSEGELQELHLTKHERNTQLRRLCIEAYGSDYKCQACGFDFKKMYGEIGKEYIEVHHLHPISMSAGRHKVDPAKDLVPLCANCHAMIHRLKGEEMTIEKLKSFINPGFRYEDD